MTDALRFFAVSGFEQTLEKYETTHFVSAYRESCVCRDY